MSNKKRIILITILSIILVALLTAFVFATINFASSKKAHAEYDDITSDTVVNFNQLSNWYTRSNEYYNITVDKDGFYNVGLTNTSITWARIYLYGSGITIDSTHKYYVKYDSNWGTQAILYSGTSGSVLGRLNSGEPQIITGYTNYQFGLDPYFNSYPSGSIKVRWQLIDVSLMYGLGNEPTLEQCKKIFTSPYYYFTTGQPMFFGLNQNDMFYNLDYQFNTGLISGYEYNLTNSTITYNSSGQLIFSARYADNYTPYWLINFKTTIPKGSIITVNLNSYTTQTAVGFAICYTDENETMITDIPPSNNTNSPFNYSFTTTQDLSALYIIERGSQFTNGVVMTIFDGSINVQLVNDYKFNLQAQYDLGYTDAQTYYTDGYGRQIIWGEGYDVGYTRGVSEGSLSDGWTFLSTLFGGIGTIFSLEIFPNITVGTFVMIPLLLGLIFFIVKLSRGGS